MIAKRITSLVIAGALWLTGCGAPFEPETDWPDASPAIWEITARSGEKGWVFGTVHALPDDMAWGSSVLDEAFEKAGVLVVEVANLDDPAGMGFFADLSETPGQPPLQSRVEPGERPALQALMEEADMADTDFGRVESWAAAMMLSSEVRSGDPANGVDRVLIHNAEDVIGLEGFSQQLEMFDTLSQEAQADLLYGVARSHQANSEQEMLLAWLTGDEERLATHVNDTLDFSPELKRVLLSDRNARWVERIAELVDAGARPFVAVGAGHVIGDEGVVAMLQARGYEARRIQ